MDGSDAVMLSGETATGTTVQVLRKWHIIIKAVENSPLIPQNTPQIKTKFYH
jgi:pyruvate kinase